MWNSGTEQSPAHKAGHNALPPLWWRHSSGWRWTSHYVLEAHGPTASSIGTPETTEAQKEDMTTHRGRNKYLIGHDTYLYTSADECRSQLMQSRLTGRHLRQGGSSRTTAAAAAVPAQRTGTQPGTPQPRSPWSYPFPVAHPRVCWKLERSDVIPPNHICRAEAAEALSNDGSWCNGWQSTIDKVFEKATGITTKFCL